MNDIVSRARLFAVAAHAAIGQVRKYTGVPYSDHCHAVAITVWNTTGSNEATAAGKPRSVSWSALPQGYNVTLKDKEGLNMSIIALALISSITAADCQKDIAFSIELKGNGFVCLSNSGELYVKPGTNMDTAAANFLATLSKTARILNENASLRGAQGHAGI